LLGSLAYPLSPGLVKDATAGTSAPRVQQAAGLLSKALNPLGLGFGWRVSFKRNAPNICPASEHL
jgi:hypothetical protein